VETSRREHQGRVREGDFGRYSTPREDLRLTEPIAIGIAAQLKCLSGLTETVDPSHGRFRIFVTDTSRALDPTTRGNGTAFVVADIGPSGAVVGIIGAASFKQVEACLLERQPA
jgi:hypothetical protein